jgi:hypothetical protein
MELICMRLADMERVHPDQVIMSCSECRERCGVFPSGQGILQRFPHAKVVCQVCRQPGEQSALAPGAEFEPYQSVRKQ